MLFSGIYKNTDKFKDMLSIIHGYAYPYPRKHEFKCEYLYKFKFRKIYQNYTNTLIDTGKWLYRPFLIKGIVDSEI